MGINTKVLLTSAPCVLDTLKFADKTWQAASLMPFGTGTDAYWLNFKDGKDQRGLAVFTPEGCANDYADVCTTPAVYMTMGCWGNSEAIARRFAVHFGGMIMVNDCEGGWINV